MGVGVGLGNRDGKEGMGLGNRRWGWRVGMRSGSGNRMRSGVREWKWGERVGSSRVSGQVCSRRSPQTLEFEWLE